jgi:hypothetical protein
LHVSFYVFLSTACLFLHSFQYAVFVPLAFLIAISQLFSSYESPHPAESIFHAFFFIGLGSLLFPQLLYFVPLFYLGMINFRSLSLKSFFAGLIGLCVPYWLFFGYAFCYDKMNPFYQLVQPALRKLAGEAFVAPLRIPAIAEHNFRSAKNRVDFQRGVISVNADGLITVRSTGAQGSGMFTSLCAANCFVIVEQDVPAGASVTIELFNEIVS